LSLISYSDSTRQSPSRKTGLDWDQSSAHSAVYDAERTAEIFCLICNRMKDRYRDAQERARALGWHNAGALGAAG
ncbi:MAG TPA: hypothetical protein VLN59_10420, partial [Burkholderiales bacterium]|nr:hypothetical protein [Burkholderiales bacterium]